MKLSDVIPKLQKILDDNGDLDLCVSVRHWYHDGTCDDLVGNDLIDIWVQDDKSPGWCNFDTKTGNPPND